MTLFAPHTPAEPELLSIVTFSLKPPVLPAPIPVGCGWYYVFAWLSFS